MTMFFIKLSEKVDIHKDHCFRMGNRRAETIDALIDDTIESCTIR